jgi:tRNA nucleotidyltransferase (CCA-adding enzyme)
MVEMMQIYKVGGAIRDKLLGIKSNDNDFVVVGSSPDEMTKLGFKSVGSDFPVFLHPETHEEYALARSEKKTAVGYRGFVFNATPDISLKEDLSRRDLTINAIAEDETGKLIDPFGGQDDLRRQIIRHVSDAFIEDPLRVLRVARFSAKLNFKVAADTMYLMEQIVKSGEINTLSSERIWSEINKAMLTKYSSNFFTILYTCGALQQVLPEFIPIIEDSTTFNLFKTMCSKMYDGNYPLEKRLAVLYYFVSTNLTMDETNCFIDKSGMNKKSKTLALILARYYNAIRMLNNLSSNDLYSILASIDPSRREERYQDFTSLVYFIAVTKNEQKTRNHLELIKKIVDRYQRIKYDTLRQIAPERFVASIRKEKLAIIEDVMSTIPDA